MYGRFTEKAEKAIAFSQESAVTLGIVCWVNYLDRVDQRRK